MRSVSVAERMGFEPMIRCNPYNGLANRRLQPLGHLSGAADMPDGCGQHKARSLTRQRAVAVLELLSVRDAA